MDERDGRAKAPGPKRLFLAISLPPGLGLGLRGLRGRAPELANRPLKDLHITLRFLGGTDPSLIPDILGAAERALGDGNGPRGAIPIELQGIGVFRERPPTPLFLKVGDPSGGLSALKAALDGELRGIPGLGPQPGGAFRPHVTLARLRRPFSEGLKGLLREGGEGPSLGFEAQGFALFESILGGGPPRHTALARFPL
jgi:2'-5' RNA ligase